MGFTLKNEERLAFELETLYLLNGYKKFKMRSFEEYSLYLNNSDFLISKNVISFHGLDGRLLALRPDVTLSIIKNTKATETNTEKLFYDEKVYRESGQTREFKEISQIGIELIGKIDAYSYVETVTLAIQSLEIVSENYLLDLSDMNVVTSVINAFNVKSVIKEEIYKLLKSKNIDDFMKMAEKQNLSLKEINAFRTLASISGIVSKEDLQPLKISDESSKAVDEFINVLQILTAVNKDKNISVNFSIAGNADYYNGLIFSGYVLGIPKAVLTGGRYDKLLNKLGKKAGGVGFAVYLGEIERYMEKESTVVDVLLLYNEKTDLIKLAKKINELKKQGLSVRVDTSIPLDFAYKTLINFDDKGAK